MAKDDRGKFWQVCMTCDRREFSAEPVACRCGAKMIDALDHPDNAHRKQPPARPAQQQKVPVP
jgi:hypothetical protein